MAGKNDQTPQQDAPDREQDSDDIRRIVAGEHDDDPDPYAAGIPSD